MKGEMNVFVQAKARDKRTPHPLEIGKVSSAVFGPITNPNSRALVVSPTTTPISQNLLILQTFKARILTSSTPSLLPSRSKFPYLAKSSFFNLHLRAFIERPLICVLL